MDSAFSPWKDNSVEDERRRVHHPPGWPREVDAEGLTLFGVLVGGECEVQAGSVVHHQSQHGSKD